MKQQRVELHLHTNMSAMDGMSSAEKLICRAAALGHKAIAITDHGVVQAFPEAMRTVDKLAKQGQDIKILYGAEAYFIDDSTGADIKKLPVSHLTLLAQNKHGLKNLYKLISVSHMNYCHWGEPHMPKSELLKYREGLLVGSACNQGELFQAIAAGKPWERLCEIAGFYDFLEIQPVANNQCLGRDDEQLREFNRTIVRLGDALGIPVCATGDVHFCEQEDELCRRIVLASQRVKETNDQAPLYFRSTDDMLAEFAYLGEEKAYEVVIKNPNLIADRIEHIRPISEGVYPLHVDGAEETLQESVLSRAKELYGDPLPSIVKERIEKELSCIIENGHATQYVIAQKLVQDSVEHGYLVGSRGAVGSSLAAYLAGITEVNPLAPHYVCPKCHHSEFFADGSVGSGFDLPEKTCPICGETLNRDGHDIPAEVFLGFDGEKTPDIDLNFSDKYQPAIYECLQSMFGKERVLKAGILSTVHYRSAERYVRAYAEEHELTLDEDEIQRLAEGCVGVKHTTGQHPCGVLIIPEDCDVYDFTPVQYPGNSASSGVISSHFAYYDLNDTVLKMDIVGYKVPTIYKYLEEHTGISAADVPMSDPAVYSLLTSPKALGVTEDEINCATGTLSLPELGAESVRQMLIETQPKNFSDLMQISGLSHGTGVWIENAQELIKDDVCTISNVIATRDNIMTYLIRKGMASEMAYEIMEIIRKGRASRYITEEHQNMMRDHGVPEWYIDSCMKIRYLFPKAHVAAYMMAAVRLGWYKIYRPAEYYAAYFTVHRQEFDGETVMNGKDAVHQALKEIRAKEQPVFWKETDMYHMYQTVYEAMARGITFLPPDPDKSHATKFLREDRNIRLPLPRARR